MCQTTTQLISNTLPSVVKEPLTSGKEFWDASKTLKMLFEGEYFRQGAGDDRKFTWPEALKCLLSEGDALGLTPSGNQQLAVSALGAITW